MNEDERELGWDDTIENDNAGQEPILPPGTYPFEIVQLKRGRHQPKATGKLPACPKAELVVRVYAGNQSVDVDHTLFLHSRCEGMLCAFFLAIGQRRHGEPLRPDWSRVVGSRGWCKTKLRDWLTQEGEKRQSNDIWTFLDPAKAPAQATTPPPQPTYPPATPPVAQDDGVSFDVPMDGEF